MFTQYVGAHPMDKVTKKRICKQKKKAKAGIEPLGSRTVESV